MFLASGSSKEDYDVSVESQFQQWRTQFSYSDEYVRRQGAGHLDDVMGRDTNATSLVFNQHHQQKQQQQQQQRLIRCKHCPFSTKVRVSAVVVRFFPEIK